jgi:8-oxo-dGTP diphosphatase
MRPLAGSFAPHAEVDEVRWLPLDQAKASVSYLRDREVLEAAGEDDG